MKYKMKIIILFLFLLATGNLFGQELPEVVSQTPEAAALSKYSEYPVGTFTGVPAINVPLYTINSGDISLPIGLNYHAGGFKVSEEASWVGLGWTLSLNFAITRSVNGSDDFTGGEGALYPYHGIGATPNTGGTPWIIDIMEGCLADNCDFYGTPNATGGNGFHSSDPRLPSFSGSRSNIAQVNGIAYDYLGYTTSFDWEPDVYSINVLGLNAKFVLDQHQNVHFIEKSDIEITKTTNGWLARSNDGFQYFFEKKETTVTFYGKELNGAWYVTKIISPTKREMNFVYDEDTDYSWQHSYSETATVNGNYLTSPMHADPNPISSIKFKKVYLKRIDFDNGHVELIRDNILREDLDNSERLKSIKIFDSNNNQVKEFEFITSYFDSNNNVRGYFDSQFLDNTAYSYYKKRLKLEKVIEKNGVISKEHSFNYSSVNLPNKDSFSMDHWGYFNGHGNSSLIPTFEGNLPFYTFSSNLCYSPNPLSTTEKYCHYLGSNRETNPTKVGANILSEIIYPTGGKTSFEFEANEYAANLSGEVAYIDYSEHVKKTAVSGAPDTYWYSTGFPFNFDNDVMSVHDASVELVVYPNGSNPNGITLTSNMWFDISSPDYTQRYYFDQYSNGQSLSYTDTSLLDNFHGPVNLSITMPETDENKTAIITFRCKLRKEINKKYTGGLRIKKITHSDGSTSPDIVKTYEYGYTVTENGVLKNRTYGKLKVPVRYWNMVPIGPSGGMTSIRFSSSAAYSLSMYQNSHIGYDKVIENIGESGENGKNIYTYENHTNIAYTHSQTPPGVPNSVSIVFDGKLKHKASYNNQNKKLSEEIYGYNILDETIVKAIYQDGHVPDPCGGGSVYGSGRFHYYPIFSRWEPLITQIQRTYNPNDGYVETTTNYQYNTENLLPSEITTIDSKGSTLKTKNYYPNDVTDDVNLDDLGELLTTDEYNAIDKLKRVKDNGDPGDFKTSQPVQVESYKGSTLLSRQRTALAFDTLSGLTLPKYIQTAKGSGMLEDRIKFHEYDAKGNPLEVSKVDGSHIYYVWGYNDQHPIAKIENKNSTGITPTQLNLINAAKTASNSDVSPATENNLRTALANLRDGFPEAMITTYTYDPLIGVTSVTYPKYDDFNRLEFVRDADGKILSENKYHYKGL